MCDDGVPLQTQLLLRTVLRQRQRRQHLRWGHGLLVRVATFCRERPTRKTAGWTGLSHPTPTTHVLALTPITSPVTEPGNILKKGVPIQEERRADTWGHTLCHLLTWHRAIQMLSPVLQRRAHVIQRQTQRKPGPSNADFEGPNVPGNLHLYLVGQRDRTHVEMKESNELLQKLPAADIRELHATAQSLQRESTKTVPVAFL